MIRLFDFFSSAKSHSGCEAHLAAFREKYKYFRQLLTGNNAALEIIAELEELCYGVRPFTVDDVLSRTERLFKTVYDIVEDLNGMAAGQYEELFETVETIGVSVLAPLARKREIPPSRLTLSFRELSLDNVPETGGKAANLGEVCNRVHLPTPYGFAVTAFATFNFLRSGDLLPAARTILEGLDINDTSALIERCAEIQEKILATPLPPDLETELGRQAEELVRRYGPEVRLAVRSSATSEDSVASFAGQHSSILNVRTDDLADAYRRVVASAFNPRAVFYRRSRGYPDEYVIMSVLCLNMIDAKCSGVLYTRDPNDPARDLILVNAVRGLGVGAVEGSVESDDYEVDKIDKHVIASRVAEKKGMVVLDENGGLVVREVPTELRSTPCLDPGQIVTLGVYALVLEDHYGFPLDIEWAMDGDNRIFVLQARPLQMRPAEMRPVEPHSAEMSQGEKPAESGPGPQAPKAADAAPSCGAACPALLSAGSTACRGKAYGPAYVLTSDHNLCNIPEGSILVVPQTSPRLVTVLGRVKAIVTDVGSATGHLASVAREFGVPTLVGTGNATTTVPHGADVTVDATNRMVFLGKAGDILERKRAVNPMKGSPVYKAAQAAIKAISPLGLVDPEAEDFSPEGCRTLHDVIRFSHEISMREMFRMGDDAGKCFSTRVRVPLPLQLYAVDLGEALEKHGLREVEHEDVHSVPFQALLKGMLHPDVEWLGPIGVNIKGFAAIVAESAFHDPAQQQGMGGPNYLAVSRHYMNFNARLGYHFATIDSYIGESINDNYITFSFKGGAADIGRRSRRALLIQSILKHLGFKTELKADMVKGTVKKYGQEVMKTKLDMVGRLLGSVRLLDMVLSDNGQIDWYVEEFFKGNYTFKQ
ncbi:MAG: pyruvate, phosphate dikinase [Desulfovibrionaceae bacterium]|nr:pyruvate, phosphate dikinase [Desulfovibrionaceae bacterium]